MLQGPQVWVQAGMSVWKDREPPVHANYLCLQLLLKSSPLSF